MRKILVLTLLLALPLWAQVQLSGTVQVSGTTLICATPSAGTVATPTASPGAGTYSSTQSVTLSTSTSGATICYTTDGTTPTASAGSCTHGTTYSTAISVASSLTIEAIGTLASYTNSGVLSAAYTISSGSSATAVLVPFATTMNTGDNALTKPSPTLAFGKQGIDTSSAALPISISNCSNAQYSTMWGICGGSGSMSVSNMEITGTNASDFVLTGSCGSIASGSDCEPTITFTPSEASGTNETATLTVVTNNGTFTMSLTGTSATVTALPACGSTLAASTNYQASNDETCPGTAYIIGGNNIDVNLNGHTVTFNNTSSSQLATVTAYSGASGTLTLTVDTMGTPFTSGQKVAFNFPSITSPLKTMNGVQYTVLSSPAPTATSFAVTNSTTGSGSASGTVSPDVQTDGFQLAQYNANFTLHNGTVTSGAGQNVFSENNHNGGVQALQGYGFTTLGVSNMTFHMNQQFQVAIAGEGATIHDNSLNNTAAGSCAQVGCRDLYQSAGMLLGGTTSVYNNSVSGGPQGGIQDYGSGTVEYNLLNPGSSTGNNTNDFGIYAQGAGLTVSNNVILTPLTADSNSRGILISGAAGSTTGLLVEDNLIGAIETATNFEYDGCEIDGAYGIQVDDAPTSTSATGNWGLGTAINCPASGLRLTDSTSTTNTSSGNTYTAVRGTGAPTCVPKVDQDLEPGCAWGVSMDGTTGFISTGDTFSGDSGDVIFDIVGGSGVTFQSPTFEKGSNTGSYWHTFTATTAIAGGGGSPVTNVHFIDPVYEVGTSPTDLNVPAQSPTTPNMGAVTFYPADWTQTMTVVKASGPVASGALVTFTDVDSNTYTCTTNGSGVCSVFVSQYEAGNMTGANQANSLNPYGLTVSLSGCTTYTSSGLTISATASRSITLSGC